MSAPLMTQAEGVSALLKYIFSGAIGSTEGKGASYALIDESSSTFSWSAALEGVEDHPMPIDRYSIRIDRQSRLISSPEPILLSETELAAAILAATGQHLASSVRFTDGMLSISYKVTVQERSDMAYVIQLRHHGRVASMDSFMNLVSKTIDPCILPVPPVYPIPGEAGRQDATGMGRQITCLIPGVMASAVYPQLSHEEKLIFVRKMALAFQACWQIELPEHHMIGELIADEIGGLNIGPDRHYSLGGPFSSVREYLKAYIKSSLVALENQQGIEEYKERYMGRIRHFVTNRMHVIPDIVEEIPIVAMHADMGLHNVIVSSETPTDIRAVIDWEFLASAPYASLYRIIGFVPDLARLWQISWGF